MSKKEIEELKRRIKLKRQLIELTMAEIAQMEDKLENNQPNRT